ncbi:RagB/SusD family nutrient uptake outer membrane protein [Dysgonomonas termitidis]
MQHSKNKRKQMIIMKNFKIKIKLSELLLFLAVALSSCSDFLEVTPTGKTVTPTAFSDMKGIRSAMAGSYYTMFRFYSGIYYAYPDLAANMVSLSTTASPASLALYNYEIEDLGAGYWGTLYEALVNINNIIEYQPALLGKYPDSKTELESIKAQALFLRALSHFELCKIYGQPYNYTSDASHLGVPIELIAPNFDHKPARNSVKDVYAQIIKDLKDAEVLFGSSSIGTDAKTKYTVTKEAVYGLLSRVYLYMEDWENTIKYAGYVIDRVPLVKGSDYVAMYRQLDNKETEVVFRFNGSKNQGKTLQTLFNLTYKTETGGMVTPVVPSATVDNLLLSLFSPDTQSSDIRYNSIIEKVTSGSSVYYVTNKFNVTDNDPTYEHFNPIILRSSEMYLNRAEAYLNKDDLSNAAADVKAIIARALNKDVADVTVTETNKTELKRIIENERAKELCFEGHQLYDITRRKQDMVRSITTSSSIQKLTYPNDLFLKPIPQRELDINPDMVGNPTVN